MIFSALLWCIPAVQAQQDGAGSTTVSSSDGELSEGFPAKASAAPLRPAAPIKTGQQNITFDRLAQLAEYPTVIRRVLGDAAGDQADARIAGAKTSKHSVDLRKESYSIYVPEGYDGTRAYGLFVFVSPLEEAGPPKQFIRALNNQKLIFVGAHKSGNQHDVLARRIPLALHSVANMQLRYKIDPDRVYVGGVSGGAKVAGFLGVSYGDIFDGAMHIVGSEPVAEGKILLPDGPLADRIKSKNRYVFVTGKNDFNRKDVRKHSRNYKSTGFQNVTLLDISNMGHSAPSGKNFERAVKALDNAE